MTFRQSLAVAALQVAALVGFEASRPSPPTAAPIVVAAPAEPPKAPAPDHLAPAPAPRIDLAAWAADRRERARHNDRD